MLQSYCMTEGKSYACVGWVEKYFNDCLCNTKDEISFGFGFMSLICWGVAEIPQIITNFRTKSSHGVSLAFLLTWVAGDIFNLVGCLLEPATLPTQYYTALLYTVTTIVLVVQSLYYDYIYRWRMCHGQKMNNDKVDEEEKKAGHECGISIKPNGTDMTMKATLRRTQPEQLYYTSARSMAGSFTPPFRGGYLSGDDCCSDEDEAAATSRRRFPATWTSMSLPVTASLNLPFLHRGNAFRFHHENENQIRESAVVGQCLGWLMAAIYMGGRLPQIFLNIKRGSVEGLNPLMFIFALIANATYVGSIVVRSSEWESIKANMPWLLDAIVCVALDLFIILQYTYYRYFRRPTIDHEADYGFYQEARKVAAAS
ncbi:probable vacuolar amino acid transporter YPQ1 isoform X1 [Arachis duranensis]|uniref:Probable vacuolar amino acid transporter YPQ1 isoform X1 n=1 Tax=Arachis duranensis TaxID=130453 RepID=A0A6P5NM55_ARADU|nr:probable vacuolar amino acid transporter YPQ1 isoform X1 [Arachis duranensis]